MERKPLTDIPFGNHIANFHSYWQRFKSDGTLPDATEKEWLQYARMLDDLSLKSNMGIFLWNTSIPDRFIYFTDKSKLLGYESSLYTSEGGIKFSFSNTHPDFMHFVYLQNEVSFKYFSENKFTTADKINKTFNGLYRKADGTYIHGLQQTTVLEYDSSGRPLITLGFLHDVAHIKKPGSATVTIAINGEVELYKYNFDLKKLEEVKPITGQEKKVLELLSQGLDSKEIADKLNISNHTVDTHRRSLIRKTDCVDTTAVITYARLIGLI